MDALGDREEVRIALDHQPARVDAGAADIGEQRLQHLGDTAAGRRRIDVEHRAALERLLGRGGDLLEARHARRADQRLEPRRIKRLNLHLLQAGDALTLGHIASLPRPRAG
jgi:hypothetical protein